MRRASCAQLLACLRKLEPIAEPSSLFQTAIDDADKVIATEEPDRP